MESTLLRMQRQGLRPLHVRGFAFALHQSIWVRRQFRGSCYAIDARTTRPSHIAFGVLSRQSLASGVEILHGVPTFRIRAERIRLVLVRARKPSAHPLCVAEPQPGTTTRFLLGCEPFPLLVRTLWKNESATI